MKTRLLTATILFLGLACVARADTASEIRGLLEGFDAGAPLHVAGQAIANARDVMRFYRARRHEPVWVSGGPLRIADLATAIRAAEHHGLPAWRYHLARIEAGGPALNPAHRELLATDAFLSQVRHRSVGVVSPRDLDPLWFVPAGEADGVRLLDDAAAGGDLIAVLDALWPGHPEYGKLLAERARIAASADGKSVVVPPGPALKAGQSGDRVRALRERLLGPDATGDVFDEMLLAGLRRFQQDAGLEADGVAGAATLAMLNETTAARLSRVDANLERWRWLPADIPTTLLRVNIAAFQLRAIVDGREALRMSVVVGRPYRKTPVFTETLKYLVLNPYWNIPRRLATQDKLPKLREDPAAMAAQGYEARATGSDTFTSVGQVDWRAVTASEFAFQLRQRPGPANALGRVKFMLPNPYAIYLHDTPEREFFDRAERGFSSGCIRLEEPVRLAEWLLGHDGQSDVAGNIAARIDSGATETVYLNTPMPTLITYFTAFEDSDGRIIHRRDIYQRDGAIVEALRRGAS